VRGVPEFALTVAITEDSWGLGAGIERHRLVALLAVAPLGLLGAIARADDLNRMFLAGRIEEGVAVDESGLHTFLHLTQDCSIADALLID